MKLLAIAPLIPVLALMFQAPQGGLSSVEGTVTRSDNNQPVARARVTINLRPGQPGARGAAPIPIVFTDDKGRYTIPALADGGYNMQFAANGYIGQRGQPVTVAGGQPTKANVVLTPAANISGRVRDTAEQPVNSVPVELLRATYDASGKRSFLSEGTVQTNDRGEYRMYWVTPGRYYVLVGNKRDDNPFPGSRYRANGNDIRNSDATAFYPGVAEMSNARLVDLAPGAEVRGIDVILPAAQRTFSVRGRVIDSRTGQAPLRANVFAETQNEGLNSDEGACISPTRPSSPSYDAATGSFEIRDLSPGTYSVVALVVDAPVPGVTGRPEARSGAMASVSVSTSDVNGITLSVVPAATIAGRLRTEGEMPQLQLQQNGPPPRVELRTAGTNGLQTLAGALAAHAICSAEGVLLADQTFVLHNVMPGEYRVEMRLPLGQLGYFKEARLEAADVLNSPLRVVGPTNSSLEFVLKIGGGTVRGKVVDAQSQPVAGATVLLVPDRNRFRWDLYRTQASGRDGNWSFPRLAPGDYKVFAWESMNVNDWFDPAVMAEFEQRGRSLHVTDTSDETIELRALPNRSTR
jgi:hypothetical protein